MNKIKSSLTTLCSEEYLDIVDESAIPIGIRKERSKVHRDGDLHRTSHVWLVRKKHGQIQVLLQKRSENKDSHPGCYDISSAGHIPAGFDFEESAIRELKEELSVDAKKEELIYCGTRRIHWEDHFHGKAFIDNQVSRVYLLWRDIEPEQICVQESEISKVCWCSLADLVLHVKENDFPHCIFMEELNMLKNTLQNTKFSITLAGMEDIDNIIAVKQASFQRLQDKCWYLTDDAEFMRRHVKDEGFILKAMYGNTMAAFFVVRFPMDAPDSLYSYGMEFQNLPKESACLAAHMESVAVHPDFTGNGLMERLLNEAVKMAKERGFRYLFATVHPKNRYSRNNVEKAGFSILTETIKYGEYPRYIYFLDCSH